MPSYHLRLLPVVLLPSLAIALVIAIIVGWSIIFPLYHAAAFTGGEGGAGLWVIMGFGEAFLSLILMSLVWLLAAMVRRHHLLRQQDAFIDTVTHELRTPLTGLRLGLETLERRHLDPAAYQTFIHRMHTDLERLQVFIDHLIEANRLSHGERDLLHENVDLEDLLRKCCARISARYELTESWYAFTTPVPNIISDRVALETILRNLLDNAVKYAQGRPQVRVTTMVQGGRLRLEVTDQGIGFTPQQRSRLFQRFVRLQGKESRIHGTGLGLFVLAELCRRLGGTVEAHSKGTGMGATFIVTLPVTLPQDQDDG